MQEKTIEIKALYEEPLCVSIGAETDAVLCDSYSDGDVEDYGRNEFQW